MHIKFYSLLLIAATTCGAAIAQPIITGQKTIGSGQDDVFAYIAPTSDGGLIAGGYSYSNASWEKTENRVGGTYNSDYWIVKLDKAGQIQWDKTIGGTGGDALQCLQQTSDGGYILGGYSSSNISGNKTENSRGQSDYWVVKLDSSGNIQWDKTIGGNNVEWLFSLQQTTDKGYILSGHSYSGKSGEKTEDNLGEVDYWVVKLDSTGSIQWDKTLGGDGYEQLPSVVQTSDGGYLVGGTSFSNVSGQKTENSRGGDDYWIVKLDGSGNVLWDKTIGGNRTDFLYAVQQTADGGYILGGASSSNISSEKTQRIRGVVDYWVVKLDANRNIQWDKTIGSKEDDELYSLQQTADSGYILGGYSNSNISDEKTEDSRGGYDNWVVKINNLGKVQWDKTIGGSGDDGALFSPIIRETKRNQYILGCVSRSGISGDKTGRNRGPGSADYWIVKLKYTKPDNGLIAGTQNINRLPYHTDNSNNLIIYPNPAKGKITIRSKGKATFTLTNGQGKILLTKVIENTGIINVSNIPPGVYYLTNTVTGATQKIIVNK